MNIALSTLINKTPLVFMHARIEDINQNSIPFKMKNKIMFEHRRNLMLLTTFNVTTWHNLYAAKQYRPNNVETPRNLIRLLLPPVTQHVRCVSSSTPPHQY